VNGVVKNEELGGLVEQSLTRAGLWRDVKDRLDESPAVLSLGAQQRLCIARALAMQPDVLLLDEPTQALDPVSSARIEDLIVELKDTCTIVIVAHTMQQAARISDATVLFLDGELVEVGETKTFFTRPRDKRTEEYVTGRFG
jgi:phosphate transport system ATP-binding protein